MADLPFLLFPRPLRTTRGVPPGGGRTFTKPTPAEQQARLQARFNQIVRSFENLQATVAGVDPEQVIVLETLTASVENVARAVVQIPGLEWLAERDLEEVAPEFGFGDPVTDATIPKRLYALMSNQNGMTQLLALWSAWTANPAERARRNFGPFKQLFTLLADIRMWSAQDRIESTGILERWQEAVAVRTTPVSFEIEFWFRGQEARRQRAYAEAESLVQRLGGQCLDQATIPKILYHAALVELPATVVNQFIGGIQTQNYAPLLRSEGVMFFRPRAQSTLGLQAVEPVNVDFATRLSDRPIDDGDPVIAVLDGVPVENHAALAGRLVVDDPDGHGPMYQAGQQQHGTAMASVILHGDLNGDGPSLKRRIYVRPIFHPDAFNLREITPPNRLLVDLIHRAIQRIFEGDGAQPAVAPTVRIVNLSLGNPEQPFDREISPLARLLDWLSWKYKVLILVSIGNRSIPLNLGATLDGVEDEDVIARVLQAMQVQQIQKRPLSPSEAINCLSVGAVHADESPGYVQANRIDLLRGRRLPTPISTIATGFRRSTKPEILFPGGRLLFQQDPQDGNGVAFSAVQSVRAPGIMAAAPGVAPMEVNRVSHSCGSSNATALASRCAVLAYERISAMEIPGDCEPLDGTYQAVLLKALLVHGASWGDASRIIENAFSIPGDQWQRLSRIKQQFLGYGEVDIKRCLSANEQRATLLGWSTISDGEGHAFEMPLPPALAASTELRRLTATLAWLTPTNHQHKAYRRAQLWIDIREQNIGTQRDGLDAASARRGTVEHRTFKGTSAVPFIDGTKLRILVNCKEDAGTLDVPVPYAIAVTLEVGPDVQIDIYQQINSRIRPVVGIQARP
jgi:hypothetical protein